VQSFLTTAFFDLHYVQFWEEALKGFPSLLLARCTPFVVAHGPSTKLSEGHLRVNLANDVPSAGLIPEEIIDFSDFVEDIVGLLRDLFAHRCAAPGALTSLLKGLRSKNSPYRC